MHCATGFMIQNNMLMCRGTHKREKAYRGEAYYGNGSRAYSGL